MTNREARHLIQKIKNYELNRWTVKAAETDEENRILEHFAQDDKWSRRSRAMLEISAICRPSLGLGSPLTTM